MDWFLYDNGLRHERVKIGALKNFEIFTGKHLRWSQFFDKVENIFEFFADIIKLNLDFITVQNPYLVL